MFEDVKFNSLMPSLLLKVFLSCFSTDFGFSETKIVGQQDEAILTKIQDEPRQNKQSKSMPSMGLRARNTEKAPKCLRQN